MLDEAWYSTEWRRIGEEDLIRARFGFVSVRGNRRPYFSITADIVSSVPVSWERHRTINGQRYWDSGGGCCHDDIARIFPELSGLIRWHLVYDDGEPLHYISNALYWLQKHLGVYRVFPDSEPEGRRPGEPEPLEAFKSTIVFGAVADDEQRLNQVLENPTDALVWLKNRASTLRATMRHDMERHGVEYLDGPFE